MSWHVHVRSVVLRILTILTPPSLRAEYGSAQTRNIYCLQARTLFEHHFSEATMFKHCSQTANSANSSATVSIRLVQQVSPIRRQTTRENMRCSIVVQKGTFVILCRQYSRCQDPRSTLCIPGIDSIQVRICRTIRNTLSVAFSPLCQGLECDVSQISL